MSNEKLTVRYTNWRGETRVRDIIPNGNLRYGTSEWHPEPTWLLSCHEGEIVHGGWREFDLSKCDFLGPSSVDYTSSTVSGLLIQARTTGAEAERARCLRIVEHARENGETDLRSIRHCIRNPDFEPEDAP